MSTPNWSTTSARELDQVRTYILIGRTNTRADGISARKHSRTIGIGVHDPWLVEHNSPRVYTQTKIGSSDGRLGPG